MRSIRFALVVHAAVAAFAVASPAAADRSLPRPRHPKPQAEERGPVRESGRPPELSAPAPLARTTEPESPNAPAALPITIGGPAEFAETSCDAGEVERGTDIVHEFLVTNTGQRDLTVDAKPGCGCTVTEFDKIIEPGRTGKVTATVHTINFKGPISKMVTVTTNDPDHEKTTLFVRATITVPIDVQPNENIVFNGKPSQFKPQVLTIAGSDGKPFDVVSVTPQDSSFKAVLVAAPDAGAPMKPRPGTVASGAARYLLTVTPRQDLPVGPIQSAITLETTHPKVPTLRIGIFGTVAGDIDVIPATVSLSTGVTAAPEAKVQHVAIKKPIGDALKITKVSTDDPDLATRLTTVVAGREFDLEVKYAGPPTTTAIHATITLTTNDPRQPSLQVQVWGRVDPGMRPPVVQGASVQAPLKVPPASNVP